MTPEQFCYWLQGFFEISDEDILTFEQTKIVTEHLRKALNKDQPTKTPFITGLVHSDNLPSDFSNPPDNSHLNDLGMAYHYEHYMS